MKGVLLVVVLAAAFSAAAQAGQPEGFKESLRLEPAASFVAGKPVRVWCATTKAAFATAARAAGTNADGSGYVVRIGAADAYLAPTICATAIAYLNKRRVDEYDLADSLLTVAHEALHLSGRRDEGETDCLALRAMPTMIRRYFKPRVGYSVHDLMAYAWDIHGHAPPAYQGDC